MDFIRCKKNLLICYLIFPISLYSAITVTNGNDSGSGSLRQAITQANTSPDTIQFSSSLTISLTGDPLLITNTYTIDGGNNNITVSGGGSVRPFFITSGSPTIKNLTITDGKALGGAGGVGAARGAGGGGAGMGGAAFMDGSPTFENVTFVNCDAKGGTGNFVGGPGGLAGGGAGGGGLGGAGGGLEHTASVAGSGGGGAFPSYSGTTNPGNTTGSNGGFGIDGVTRVGGKGGDSNSPGSSGTRYGGGGGQSDAAVRPQRGGDGGFGGGGESKNQATLDNGLGGGNGGFGGGGGGVSFNSNGPVGLGGFGAGNGSNEPAFSGGDGGAGAALGGAIFVSELSSTTLTYTDNMVAGSAFSGNTVTLGDTFQPNTVGEKIGPNIFLRGGGSLTFNIANGVTMNLPSVIKTDPSESASTINKLGSGTLNLSSASDNDSYDFKSNINLNDGTLIIAADNNLGNAGSALSINNGTLNTTGTFNTGKITAIAGNATINTNAATTLTVTTALTGSGTLVKKGGGNLVFTQDHAIPGDLALNEGGIDLTGTTQSIGTFLGTGGTLTIGTSFTTGSADSTFSGNISGSGSLVKNGAGTLTLTGGNDYSGGTTLLDGILSISADNNLGNSSGNMTFNGGTLRTTSGLTSSRDVNLLSGGGTVDVAGGPFHMSGVLDGSGNLTKNGPGTLTLSRVHTYTGMTNIQQGTLAVNGAISGPVSVSPASFLKGTGTVGTVQNNGAVSPGSSIGTLTINGDYTQDPSAALIIEIDNDPVISDLLSISGTANLGGSVVLNPLPGIYEKGTTYKFLEANTINHQFDQLLETHPLDFALSYSPGFVEIVILFDEAVLPKPIEELKGNAKKIANYLFSCSSLPVNDLNPILKSLVKVSPENFAAALLQLGSQQFGSLALNNLQTSVRVGESMNQTSNAYNNYYLTPCYESFKDPASGLDQSIWFNPIGYYYKQNEMEEQVPFSSKTYGFTTGFSTRLLDHLVLSAGTGYTHSSLSWFENNGSADIQSVYLSPSVGYVSECGYAGLVVVGARSFYDVSRKIHFSNFKDKAHNDHKSYDLLAGIKGGLRLKSPESFQKNLFLIPTVSFDYLNIFENGYQESGAGPIGLSTRNVHSAFLRPEVKFKILKELKTQSICASPSLYVGWLRNIPLTNGYYTSRFYKQKTCEKNFTVQSYHGSTDQLVLGADLIILHKANCSLKVGYEANIGNHYNVQEGNLNFNYLF